MLYVTMRQDWARPDNTKRPNLAPRSGTKRQCATLHDSEAMLYRTLLGGKTRQCQEAPQHDTLPDPAAGPDNTKRQGDTKRSGTKRQDKAQQNNTERQDFDYRSTEKTPQRKHRVIRYGCDLERRSLEISD